MTSVENSGLGLEKGDGVSGKDSDFDMYRKRMMLAYKFRPNPMVIKNQQYNFDPKYSTKCT